MISRMDAKYQAEAFISYTNAGGPPTWWWRSKDFSKADRRRIEMQIKAIQLGVIAPAKKGEKP